MGARLERAFSFYLCGGIAAAAATALMTGNTRNTAMPRLYEPVRSKSQPNGSGLLFAAEAIQARGGDAADAPEVASPEVARPHNGLQRHGEAARQPQEPAVDERLPRHRNRHGPEQRGQQHPLGGTSK